MKTSLKVIARHAVRKPLATLGLEIHKTRPSQPPSYGLDNFFPLLQRLGFVPAHIIDVGANHGNWTRTAFRYFPSARYTLIEPQDHLKPCIQDLIDQGCDLRWINAGCSDTIGQMPFSLSHRDDSSTFVLMDRHGNRTGSQTITVPVTTLDQVTASARVPEMVKIDAEGFDLKVLAGASNLIGKTDIFLVEALICAKDRDNSFLTVINTMDGYGYDLMDMTDLNRSPKHGVLWVSELAFVRKGSSLLSTVTAYE
jgi:FkbM family methyltransferase